MKEYTKWRVNTCVVCGEDFQCIRMDAKTCSAACRAKKARRKQREHRADFEGVRLEFEGLLIDLWAQQPIVYAILRDLRRKEGARAVERALGAVALLMYGKAPFVADLVPSEYAARLRAA